MKFGKKHYGLKKTSADLKPVLFILSCGIKLFKSTHWCLPMFYMINPNITKVYKLYLICLYFQNHFLPCFLQNIVDTTKMDKAMPLHKILFLCVLKYSIFLCWWDTVYCHWKHVWSCTCGWLSRTLFPYNYNCPLLSYNIDMYSQITLNPVWRKQA